VAAFPATKGYSVSQYSAPGVYTVRALDVAVPAAPLAMGKTAPRARDDDQDDLLLDEDRPY
jgi:hypothetical protein